MTTTTPVTVTVTGAAGRIGYSLIFAIASGAMLGPATPITLRLLELEEVLPKLEGVAMELQDCGFPLLNAVDIGSHARTMFDGANHALLVGARPRTKGMARADLLEANSGIFAEQGSIINDVAAQDIRVTVTGNPANTNALVASVNAPDIPAERFTALSRLDHNRAIGVLRTKLSAPAGSITRMSVWGNHSATQYPDLRFALVDGAPATTMVDDEWVRDTFIPEVAERGTAIIRASGMSSAASAAMATVDHVRSWVLGTAPDDWVSMAVPSDGSYGVPDGIVSSFPVTCTDGKWSIVEGLAIDDESRTRIAASVRELVSEKAAALG